MTVQELIDILQKQDPSDIVCINAPEEMKDMLPVGDWTTGRNQRNGEIYHFVTLYASEWP